MRLEVDQIVLGYGDVPVVENLSFALDAGQIGCLLGASGCGKTTTLRAIAGFEPLAVGEIRINGRSVSGPDIVIPPEQRSVGMVFQDHALFPHLTVFANIEFGIRKQTTRQRRRIVAELLELTGLTGLDQRYPHELSGGQQQRVALARALAPEPAVLLMDEPFSNLDTGLRRQMGLDIRTLLTRRGTATLLVTHDQMEAFALADQIGLMHDGHLLQWGDPYELYHRPLNRTVASFTGRGAYIRARVRNGRLHHVLGSSPWPHSEGQMNEGAPLDLLIRPDDIQPDAEGCRARVISRQFQGANILYQLQLENGERVGALFTSHENHEEGETIGIRLEADHLVMFAPEEVAA
ncbi:MAG: ABC transporter ATP-binding protein [Pseudomonadota bacterium]